MTELEFLDRQHAVAIRRLKQALLGHGLTNPPSAAIERAALRRPWLTLAVAAATGTVVGGVLGRSRGRALGSLARFAGRRVWAVLRSATLGR